MVDMVLHSGRITTLDGSGAEAEAIAIRDGLIEATGTTDEIMRLADNDADIIDVGGRRVIPGLNDSHTHLIRGGLNYNMELRWEGVPSLSDALRMLKDQAERTPAPQWVRVVGGWSEFQFSERRMPTLDEINAASPDTPVFILHLYGRALLNRVALRVLGINKDTPDPPGGMIERGVNGEATGMLLATPSALILYSTLAQGPKLPLDDQINSTRHFMRELNRLGITSVIDAGGGGQNYPQDYDVVRRLHDDGQLTVRIAYNLFAQNAGEELSDYERWLTLTEPGAGDAMLRMNGAGENLAWSAADFENFLEPRPDLAPVMESELEPIVELLAVNRWPFRITPPMTNPSTAFLASSSASTARRHLRLALLLIMRRPSVNTILSVSMRSVAVLRFSTAWHSRVSILSIVMVPEPPKPRRQSPECWQLACRSVAALMRPVLLPTIHGMRFTGLRQVKRLVGLRFMTKTMCLTGRQRWGSGRKALPGFPAKPM